MIDTLFKFHQCVFNNSERSLLWATTTRAAHSSNASSTTLAVIMSCTLNDAVFLTCPGLSTLTCAGKSSPTMMWLSSLRRYSVCNSLYKLAWYLTLPWQIPFKAPWLKFPGYLQLAIWPISNFNSTFFVRVFFASRSMVLRKSWIFNVAILKRFAVFMRPTHVLLSQ